MEAAVFSKPTLDTRMLVRGVVVADDVDLLVGIDRLIDPTQELQPLLMAMALLAQTIDLAGSRVERRKECLSIVYCFR